MIASERSRVYLFVLLAAGCVAFARGAGAQSESLAPSRSFVLDRRMTVSPALAYFVGVPQWASLLFGGAVVLKPDSELPIAVGAYGEPGIGGGKAGLLIGSGSVFLLGTALRTWFEGIGVNSNTTYIGAELWVDYLRVGVLFPTEAADDSRKFIVTAGVTIF